MQKNTNYVEITWSFCLASKSAVTYSYTEPSLYFVKNGAFFNKPKSLLKVNFHGIFKCWTFFSLFENHYFVPTNENFLNDCAPKFQNISASN